VTGLEHSGGLTQPLRRGVVAVIRRSDRFLVIQRSAEVEAPGAFCFPGGGIEACESEIEALRREMREELNCEIIPLRRLWESVTPWRVWLAWWSVALPPDLEPSPNPREVQAVKWLTELELQALPGLLASNVLFLDAWQGGQFTGE
jgi:8-oxo-dGTP diphosphatase